MISSTTHLVTTTQSPIALATCYAKATVVPVLLTQWALLQRPALIVKIRVESYPVANARVQWELNGILHTLLALIWLWQIALEP